MIVILRLVQQTLTAGQRPYDRGRNDSSRRHTLVASFLPPSNLIRFVWLGFVAAGLSFASPSSAQISFAHLEGRQTHPIGLTPDGTRLLALNTPDGKLSVFHVSRGPGAVPVLVGEIPVGLEPVSLRARHDDEVWIVNELSDSVSVVSLSRRTAIDTLPCPDEPADVVFAQGKAFVSCARNNLLRVSFEVANLLYNTPTDALKDVGNFSFTGQVRNLTPPVISQVTLNGGNLMVRGSNGLPGSSYTLLFSGKIGLTLSAWTTSAVGIFDADGQCVIPIPIPASATAGFFNLQQP